MQRAKISHLGMDLLWNAYSNDSEEDDDGEIPKSENFTQPPSKRPKLQYPITLTRPQQHPLPCLNQSPVIPRDAPVPGRYISKRERALVGGSLPAAPEHEKVPAFQGICSYFSSGNFLLKISNLEC